MVVPPPGRVEPEPLLEEAITPLVPEQQSMETTVLLGAVTNTS